VLNRHTIPVLCDDKLPNTHKRSVQLPDEHFETLKEIFGCKYEERVVNGVKTRLMRDYYVSNILKILLALSKNRLPYEELYERSKIRNEDTFLKYLRWMIKLGMLAKDGSSYSITPKGMKILDAFS